MSATPMSATPPALNPGPPPPPELGGKNGVLADAGDQNTVFRVRVGLSRTCKRKPFDTRGHMEHADRLLQEGWSWMEEPKP